MTFYNSIILALLLLTTGCTYRYSTNYNQYNGDYIFQVSTLSALEQGVYEGNISFKQLEQYGDFGLGTFNGLDGEMIETEGKVYQIRADGIAYPADKSRKTPFATVTFFEPDDITIIEKPIDCDELYGYIDDVLPTKNIIFAVKVKGLFEYVQTRSVSKQGKPYPKLSEALEDEPEFEFHGIGGIMVGFRFPDYVDGINVPGYHFHFITSDEKHGGHLLRCRTRSVGVEIDYSNGLIVKLPNTPEFYRIDVNN